jgi:hypothetical protein
MHHQPTCSNASAQPRDAAPEGHCVSSPAVRCHYAHLRHALRAPCCAFPPTGETGSMRLSVSQFAMDRKRVYDAMGSGVAQSGLQLGGVVTQVSCSSSCSSPRPQRPAVTPGSAVGRGARGCVAGRGPRHVPSAAVAWQPRAQSRAHSCNGLRPRPFQAPPSPPLPVALAALAGPEPGGPVPRAPRRALQPHAHHAHPAPAGRAGEPTRRPPPCDPQASDPYTCSGRKRLVGRAQQPLRLQPLTAPVSSARCSTPFQPRLPLCRPHRHASLYPSHPHSPPRRSAP